MSFSHATQNVCTSSWDAISLVRDDSVQKPDSYQFDKMPYMIQARTSTRKEHIFMVV